VVCRQDIKKNRDVESDWGTGCCLSECVIWNETTVVMTMEARVVQRKQSECGAKDLGWRPDIFSP